MRNEEFAAACERLALGKEIKRQEANAAVLIRAIEAKKARLAQLEREAERRRPAVALGFYESVTL